MHAIIFTKLDLRSGYNNVRIRDEDQWKAAFVTNKGLFKLNIMFFGLTNVPMTFQHMINDLFANYIAEGWIVIYMDNILIFSTSIDKYHQYMHLILE